MQAPFVLQIWRWCKRISTYCIIYCTQISYRCCFQQQNKLGLFSFPNSSILFSHLFTSVVLTYALLSSLLFSSAVSSSSHLLTSFVSTLLLFCLISFLSSLLLPFAQPVQSLLFSPLPSLLRCNWSWKPQDKQLSVRQSDRQARWLLLSFNKWAGLEEESWREERVCKLLLLLSPLGRMQGNLPAVTKTHTTKYICPSFHFHLLFQLIATS